MMDGETHNPEENSIQTIIPNLFGLKDMGEDLQEWVVGKRVGQEGEREAKKGQVKNPYSSLVIGKSPQIAAEDSKDVLKSSRYPWEGFYDVGFRCVTSISTKFDKM